MKFTCNYSTQITLTFLGIFLMLFSSSCKDDVIDVNDKKFLIGKYWLQYDSNINSVIKFIDNANAYSQLWDENGMTSFGSGGMIYYFVDKNTVHQFYYLGFKSHSDAKKAGLNDLIFTFTYGYDTVYFYGDLDNPSICNYEILDGILYIYSNSDVDIFNVNKEGFVLSGGSSSSYYRNIDLQSVYEQENPTTKITEGQKVDLGLSVKWAGWNIGANAPYEFGGYYAWGETFEKRTYTPEYYTLEWENTGKIEYDKYGPSNASPIYIGRSEYDVAKVKWGNEWRLPSRDELEELIKSCTFTSIRYKDTYGLKVTGPNGNSIFLPFAGTKIKSNNDFENELGFYWLDYSGSVYKTNGTERRLASGLGIDQSGAAYQYLFVDNGASIRAVSDN